MMNDYSYEPKENSRFLVFYKNKPFIEMEHKEENYQGRLKFNDFLVTWHTVFEDIINGEYTEDELKNILKMLKAKYKNYDYSHYKKGQMTIYDY